MPFSDEQGRYDKEKHQTKTRKTKPKRFYCVLLLIFEINDHISPALSTDVLIERFSLECLLMKRFDCKNER